MYSDKDLDSLKEEYLNQDYPDDLNKHIIKCISKQSNKKFKKFNYTTNICVGLLFASCLLLAIIPRALKKYEIDSHQINDEMRSYTQSTYDLYSNIPKNLINVAENNSIISIYKDGDEIYSNNMIYNIDKTRGVLIELKDILIEKIEDVDIDKKLKDILLNHETKFFLNEDGSYIILSESGKILIDNVLKSKIFKPEYMF
ncbi:hypothetical protein [Candidatus Arthromitus sp. SFB-rat-Yit]|uniref:hypothetical protein n=1 Tax=Candidatus Arthromitus sp. SFB-rat-Yit TaxID=1041504 RepID=UPI000227A563|nr:hypothetical protein [Candidatus Arthromitus sp. SFB-rat-Yit]BAK81015.1 hypothetical protein RATSFB_0453 [Candidatus Arthromitus sp. SFB-rat-Yit]